MFRYWKVSNIPLFLLAAPTLYVLARSGIAQLQSSNKSTRPERLVGFVTSMAAAQVLLSVLTLTSYHVQIITRLASGYPLWYWWLAGQLVKGQKPGDGAKGGFSGSGFVVFMVMYASIQAVLFASFLPPA